MLLKRPRVSVLGSGRYMYCFKIYWFLTFVAIGLLHTRAKEFHYLLTSRDVISVTSYPVALEPSR